MPGKLKMEIEVKVPPVAHVDQYFGVWCIHEPVFRAIVDNANTIDLAAHVKAATPASGEMAEDQWALLPGGVALVDLAGPLMKFRSSMSSGTSTVAARRNIRAAVADGRTSSLMIRIDSPGGTVAGTSELAEAVAEASDQMPVHVFIEDLGASAAFWVASQADRITANASALVGSIGTFAVLTDQSAFAEDLGVKVIVVRAGEFKGAGEPGTAVTDEHVAETQRIVDGLNEQFLSAVASGRSMKSEDVKAIADGRVHLASDALALGLIDSVLSFDEAVAELVTRTGSAKSTPRVTNARAQERTAMSKENGTDDLQLVEPAAATTDAPAKPATYHQLAEGCRGASEAFICEQLKNQATTEQARNAFIASLVAEKADLSDELSKLRSAAASAGGTGLSGRGGVGPAAAESDVDGDPIERFNALVEERVEAGDSRAKALSYVVRNNKALHAEYLAAVQTRTAQ